MWIWFKKSRHELNVDSNGYFKKGGWFGVAVTTFVTLTKLSYVEPS